MRVGASCASQHRFPILPAQMYHDTCPKNVSDAFEEYLHAVEDACVEQGCNAPGSASYNPNVCGAQPTPRPAGAAAVGVGLASLALALAAALAVIRA
jgi:hypothetical protein